MKRKIKIGIFLVLLFSVFAFSISKITFGIESVEDKILVEYTDEFQEWLELPDSEKEGCTIPRMYDVESSSISVANPLKQAKMGEIQFEEKFSLQGVIPENVTIKNQGSTSACWAFTAAWILETSLAMRDYKNGFDTKVYNFSERHIDYATSSVFADTTNKYGYYRRVGSGGYDIMAYSYFTNGLGAIPEEEMPFENNKNILNISEIQNKTVSSRVYDLALYPSYRYESTDDEVMKQLKYHIKNYGAVSGSVLLSSSVINTNTGALYNNSYSLNHAVAIIGWDDNYSASNFKSGKRPKGDGAWIVANSSSYDDILYVSYYDYVIANSAYAIINAVDYVDYDNIYQHDFFGPVSKYYYESETLYLANEFEKETDGVEYLSEVSIFAAEDYEVTVYVNPNGTGKTQNDLQHVQLVNGDTATISTGYHTLEFLNPIEITGEEFVIAMEIQTGDSRTYFYEETKSSELNIYKNVTISGKSYYGGNSVLTDSSAWKLSGGDNTIKGFTVSEIIDDSLGSIVIEAMPSKTTYLDGDNFDSTGMVVMANFNNGETRFISGYDVINGTNLNEGQTSVTILYGDKTVMVPITVLESEVTSIKIKNPPSKTEYKAGENFDTTGMVIEANFNAGFIMDITDYIVVDGINLKNNQGFVTISYSGRIVEQPITVSNSLVEKIVIDNLPNKIKYVENQKFDTTGMVVIAKYEDGREVEVADYDVVDGTNLKVEQTSVTISYEGVTTTLEITVSEKSVVSLTVSKIPTKTVYNLNKEKLDLSGGIIKVTYDDGMVEDIQMDSDDVKANGFSNENVGSVTVVLSYKSKSTSISLEIVDGDNPIISNFQNATGSVKKLELYNFSDVSKQNYSLMHVEVNNIEKSSANDSIKYYYYLSTNQGLENIDDWVEITNVQTDSNKLSFIIDTNDFDNQNELYTVDNLYLYIQEIAKKGGNQKSVVSDAILIKIDGEIITYKDGVELGIYETGDGENISENPQTSDINVFIIVIVLLGSFIASSYLYRRSGKNYS